MQSNTSAGWVAGGSGALIGGLIGDYVDFPGEDDIRTVPLKGKVKSRCFNYKLGYCYVTIVVEESADADWTCIRP